MMAPATVPRVKSESTCETTRKAMNEHSSATITQQMFSTGLLPYERLVPSVQTPAEVPTALKAYMAVTVATKC
jgi:hypothetical protein